jgi:hypothetical protein
MTKHRGPKPIIKNRTPKQKAIDKLFHENRHCFVCSAIALYREGSIGACKCHKDNLIRYIKLLRGNE